MKLKVFLLICALMSALSLVGCYEEHKVDKNQEQQEKDNRESGLDWYTNPANPIGLFSSLNN